MCDLHYPFNCKTNIYLKYMSLAHYYSYFFDPDLLQRHIYFPTVCTTFVYLLLDLNSFYKHNLCIIVSTLLLTT
jgi:hypothetical protein